MLFKPTGGKLQRLHGPFVTDDEVQAVADHWRRQCAPQYEVDFTEWGTSLAENAKASSAPASGPGSSDEESLYAEAVAFVQEQGRMSISLLQRRFRIGFNKAARFVERMEEEGILPPASRASQNRADGLIFEPGRSARSTLPFPGLPSCSRPSAAGERAANGPF